MILLDSLPQLKNSKNLFIHLLKVNFLLLVSAILCIIFTDQPLAQFFAQEKAYGIRNFARHITDIGLSEHYFIGAIFLFCYFHWLAPRTRLWQTHSAKAKFLKTWALNSFAALISAGILALSFKFLIGRQRPHRTEPIFDPFVFEPFSLHWNFQSFPSGHAQTMFTVATMMCLAFPKFKWLWIFWAVGICITRVIVHSHFLSDTIYGASIGYTGAMIALYLMRTRTKYGL